MSPLGRAARRALLSPLRFVRDLRWLGRRTLTIRWSGLELRYAIGSDVAREWFLPRYGDGRSVHEPPVCRLLMERLGPGRVFFDVGANLGFFTVLGAHLCRGDGGEVHAFEPDPALAARIPDSLALNDELAPVVVNSFACWDGDGALCPYRPAQPGNPSTNRIVSPEPRGGGVARVSAGLTLDAYCRRTGTSPDVVKVDVEGGEGRVAAGSREVIARERPTLLLEIHPEALRRAGEDPMALVDEIRRRGRYRVRALEDHRRPSPEGGRPALIELADDSSRSALEGRGPVVLLFEADDADARDR